MGENFLRLKRRFLLEAIIKSVVLGVSVGLIVGLGIALVQRLMIGEAQLLLCILVGLGSAIASGGAMYLLDFPSDKRIALKLDKRLSFNEKVQTMVSFRSEKGPVIDVQRENADEALGQIDKRKLRKRTFLLNLIAPVLAIAMLVVLLVVPPKEIEKPDDDDKTEEIIIDATKTQEVALRNLIDYVKDSNMEDAPKALVLEKLNGLLDALTTDGFVKQSQVLEAMSATQLILDNANSADDISYELNAGSNEMIRELASVIQSLNYIQIPPMVQKLRETVSSTATKGDIKALTATYAGEIKTALVNSAIENTDLLFIALLQTANELEELSGRVSETTMSKLQKELDAIFEKLDKNVVIAMRIQSNNDEVADTVITTLASIFGIAKNDIPRYDDEDSFTGDGSPSDTPPEQGVGGGLGGGDKLYGSNDKIYDPNSEEFVEYGKLIDAYFSAILSDLQDGRIPQELEDFISSYFSTLNRGD